MRISSLITVGLLSLLLGHCSSNKPIQPQLESKNIPRLTTTNGPITEESGQSPKEKPHNLIVFVADGLRAGMVTPENAPTMAKLRDAGVNFAESHSIYPTLTMTNAAAIATGHSPGDTSNFGNTVYSGYSLFDTASFPSTTPGTFTPFLENNRVLGDLNLHFNQAGYINEESLLSLARANGYNTAAVGKVGPVLIQDLSQANPVDGVVPPPVTVIVDDSTGKVGGLPFSKELAATLSALGLSSIAPSRDNSAPGTPQDNGKPGDNITAGTLAPNTVQQTYFIDVLTKAVLPKFEADQKPFVIIFWSRDPDGTQHNQGDSLGKVVPGINGPTTLAAIQNADQNLQSILTALNADPKVADITDVVVTADHGFSTISRHDLEGGAAVHSYASTFAYKTTSGAFDVAPDHLPPGFLAIDLSHYLNLPLFDPDSEVKGQPGVYVKIDPAANRTDTVGQYPKAGNGLIGGTGRAENVKDTAVIVTANGGSDLIYIPSGDPALAQKVTTFLASQDYVSGIFANDAMGEIAGALPLSSIQMHGNALLPTPALVVNFRSFSTDSNHPFNTQVIIADTTLQQGQGMHGSFGRGDTFNFMAAQGPDFKSSFVDVVPVSNADLPVTLAAILKFKMSPKGNLMGRVIDEARVGGPNRLEVTHEVITSTPAEGNGPSTVLNVSHVGSSRYYDAAGFSGRTLGLKAATPR